MFYILGIYRNIARIQGPIAENQIRQPSAKQKRNSADKKASGWPGMKGSKP